MTSKISFFKLARDEWRKLAWLTAVQGVVLGLLIPFRLLVIFLFRIGSTYGPLTANEKQNIFCANMGLSRWENVPVILILGVVCALCAFAYLYSAPKLDLYHSLPVTREVLFGAKYLGSVMTFVTAYVLSQFLGILMGCLYGAVSFGSGLEAVVAVLQGILFFLCSYSAAVLAVMLTGKLLTTVCALGVFAGYIPVLLLLRETLQELFLCTSMLELSRGKAFLAYSSPWAVCLFWGSGQGQVGRVGLTGRFPTIGGLCQLVALASLTSLLALVLYRYRRTEAAGTAIAFRPLESVVKILLAVPATLVAAVVPYGGAGIALWEGAFIVIFGVLACAIMEFIYRWDIRQALMHKSHMVITVAVGALLYFSLRYDVMGFNTYLPKQEELEAMAVAEEWSSLGYEIDGAGIRYDVSRQMLDMLETGQVDALYRTAENGVANVKEYGIGYDMEPDSRPVRAVCVKYRLKSGKEVYRKYTVDEELLGECLNQAFQDQELHRRYYPILGWQPEDITAITYNSRDGLLEELLEKVPAQGTAETDAEEDTGEASETQAVYDKGEIQVTVPYRQRKAFLLAYQEDFSRLTPQEIWDAWRGSEIHFEKRLSDSDDEVREQSYPLSGRFTGTVRLLREIVEEQYREG